MPRPEHAAIGSARVYYWPIDKTTAILEIEHTASSEHDAGVLNALHRTVVATEVLLSQEAQEAPRLLRRD